MRGQSLWWDTGRVRRTNPRTEQVPVRYRPADEPGCPVWDCSPRSPGRRGRAPSGTPRTRYRGSVDSGACPRPDSLDPALLASPITPSPPLDSLLPVVPATRLSTGVVGCALFRAGRCPTPATERVRLGGRFVTLRAVSRHTRYYTSTDTFETGRFRTVKRDTRVRVAVRVDTLFPRLDATVVLTLTSCGNSAPAL